MPSACEGGFTVQSKEFKSFQRPKLCLSRAEIISEKENFNIRVTVTAMRLITEQAQNLYF